MIVTESPQKTLLTEEGFTDMAMFMTWKGPGRRQTPEGTTFAETGAPPLLVAMIEAFTANVEVNWMDILFNVYVTVWVVCPALKLTLPGMVVFSIFQVYETGPLPPGAMEICALKAIVTVVPQAMAPKLFGFIESATPAS